MGLGYRIESGTILSDDIPRIKTKLDVIVEMYNLHDFDDSLRKIKEGEIENGVEDGKTVIDTLSTYLVSKLYTCAHGLVKEYENLFPRELKKKLFSINKYTF